MKVFLVFLGLLSSLVPTLPALAAEPVAAPHTDSTPCLTAWLTSKHGVKRLGRLQEFDVDSGQPPVGPPVVLGVLQSPWEPRIAVLVRQNQTDTEAAIVPLVRVFGARLDSRWRPAE